MTLQIKQKFNYQKNDACWLWSVWIDGEPTELDSVESVCYTLHSSYSPPVRIVTDRISNFSLIEKAYEGFTIYASIAYQDGHEEHLQHELTFAKISIKSERQQSKDQTWDWQLSIEGDAAELDKIQSVTYQLPNVKKKTTRDRKSGFKIEGNNSGIITAVVDVKLSDKRSLRFVETLQLSAGRESEDEEKLKEITEIAKIANELFTPPSPEKTVDQNAPPPPDWNPRTRKNPRKSPVLPISRSLPLRRKALQLKRSRRLPRRQPNPAKRLQKQPPHYRNHPRHRPP